MKLDEKALEAAMNAISYVCQTKDVADAIRAYIEAATPPDVAGLIERLEGPLPERQVGVGRHGDRIVDYDYPAISRLLTEAATALRLSAGGGEKGQWKEVETNFLLKGQRTSPAYYPATGEVCEVSGPNCDDANGYTWMSRTVLWQNEKFVLYGLDGFWPNLHKRERVLFRPLPASPTVEATR